jgi:hypothetical protein
MPDGSPTIDLSSGQIGGIVAGAGAFGAVFAKGIDRILLRFSASTLQNHEQLVKLVKEQNTAQIQTALALSNIQRTMDEGFKDLIAAIPKRSESA